MTTHTADMNAPTESLSLQDTFGADTRCFGCGPANEQGLRIKSFVEGDVVVARWRPERHHEAFDGVLNGGICGALLDCHGNWTAAWALMLARGLDQTPPTVTAEFHVKLRRPTPTDCELLLRAWAVAIDGDKVTIEAELVAGDKVTATCRGIFIAVHEGHPAFPRW